MFQNIVEIPGIALMLRNKRIVFHAAGLLFSHAQFFFASFLSRATSSKKPMETYKLVQ